MLESSGVSLSQKRQLRLVYPLGPSGLDWT